MMPKLASKQIILKLRPRWRVSQAAKQVYLRVYGSQFGQCRPLQAVGSGSYNLRARTLQLARTGRGILGFVEVGHNIKGQPPQLAEACPTSVGYRASHTLHKWGTSYITT